jgi:hypothetical protein
LPDKNDHLPDKLDRFTRHTGQNGQIYPAHRTNLSGLSGNAGILPDNAGTGGAMSPKNSAFSASRRLLQPSSGFLPETLCLSKKSVPASSASRRVPRG